MDDFTYNVCSVVFACLTKVSFVADKRFSDFLLDWAEEQCDIGLIGIHISFPVGEVLWCFNTRHAYDFSLSSPPTHHVSSLRLFQCPRTPKTFRPELCFSAHPFINAHVGVHGLTLRSHRPLALADAIYSSHSVLFLDGGTTFTDNSGIGTYLD